MQSQFLTPETTFTYVLVCTKCGIQYYASTNLRFELILEEEFELLVIVSVDEKETKHKHERCLSLMC